MKGKIALSIAAVMAFSSFSAATMAASSNSLSEIFGDINADEILIKGVDNRSVDILSSPGGIDTIASGTAIKLQLRPTVEVESGSSIILTVENCKFDERLVNADPFIFRSKVTGTTYDEIAAEAGDNWFAQESVLEKYIGGEGSAELPYGFKYIDEKNIEVYLYPISSSKSNQNNSDVTIGTPYYSIPLPITTEGSKAGDALVYVDSNDSAISFGTYIFANVVSESGTPGDDESTTEATTEDISETTTDVVTEETTDIVSEETTNSAAEESTEVTTNSETTEVTTEGTTETTTRKPNQGSGGGGSSSRRTTTTTTTTEATTEFTTDEVSTEETTEVTTEEYKLPEVRVSIGSSNIVVDNKTYSMDAAPYIQSSSNSTLVPLRFVAVALSGGNVEDADTSDIVTWDGSTKQAIINKNGIKIVFKAGSNKVTVNGQEMAMDYGVTAEIYNDRMFVPFRVIGENLGYNVKWESNTKTAVFESK